MISGVGLLLLTMNNRYSHVIDRARQFARDLERVEEGKRRDLIGKELDILYRRARILRVSITLGSISVLFVGVTVFSLFAEQLMNIRADYVSVPCFGLSLISLMASVYFFIRDVGLSLTALELEIAPHIRLRSK